MRELSQKTIDGKKYEFSQLGPKESLRTLTRLYKIVGQPMVLAFGALNIDTKKKSKDGKQNLLDGIDKDLLAKAVDALAQRMDEDQVIDLIEGLVAKDHCLCEGVRVNSLIHYDGRLGHMFKVLAAALEVQYGNFFVELLGMSKGLSGVADMTQALRT